MRPARLAVPVVLATSLVLASACGSDASPDGGALSGAVGDGGARGDATTSGAATADGGLGSADGAASDAVPGAANPDGSTCPPSSGPSTAPAFGPSTVTTTGLRVRVMNHCPTTIWIHGEGGGATKDTVLLPDGAELAPGATRDYDGTDKFASGRVTAFDSADLSHQIQFVELNYVDGKAAYNVSYVDFVGLPVEVDSDCGIAGCNVPLASLLDTCPANLREGNVCLSANVWCGKNGNWTSAYCTQMDESLKTTLALPVCAKALSDWRAAGNASKPVGNTPEIYGCKDFWSQSPYCCAAANRGMNAAPDSKDTCAYYQAAPYNSYSKWVHQTCPGIYAFPYDDSAGGLHQCATKEIRITWCPGG